MKWFLAAVGVAVVAAFAYLQLNSVKTTYVNGLAPYTALPGREFIVERDCYVFKFKSSDTDWPLLGSREVVPDLPAEVSATNVGAEFNSVLILDFIHFVYLFRIASVRRDTG